MFEVTAAARDRLSKKLAQQEPTEGVALRFTRRTGGWKLRLDRPRPDDTVFNHGAQKVLVLDAEVAKAMAALTLDVSSTEAGARLKLRRVPESE
jgi:Fe-S cluster assembly iron-binding protein IscA